MKRVYIDKRRRYLGQQPGTKSGLRTTDYPLVNRSLCSSIGLHRNSFVRASEETFRTVVYDAPESKRDSCVLCEPTRRRSTLPGTALPPRPAPSRPDLLLVCPGLGIDRSTFDCLRQCAQE